MGYGDYNQVSVYFNPALINLSPSDTEQIVHAAPVLVLILTSKETKGLIRNI